MTRVLLAVVCWLLFASVAHAQTKPTCPVGVGTASWSCQPYITGSAATAAQQTDLLNATRPANGVLFGPLSVSQILGALTAAQVETALGFVPLSSTNATFTNPTIVGTIAGSADVGALQLTLPNGNSRSMVSQNTDTAISVLDYWNGQTANGQSCTPVVSIAASSTTLTTDGSCNFSSSEIGQTISIQGAGPSTGYGPITALNCCSGSATPGTYIDSLPYAYILASSPDAYQYGGVDAVFTTNGSVTAVSSVVNAGAGCTTGTFTLTAANNPIGSTAATVQGVFSGGVLTSESVLSGGAYSSIVPLGPVTFTGNSGCTTNPTLHLSYTPSSITVVKGGMGYNAGNPGTVYIAYGWQNWPTAGTTTTTNWIPTVTPASAGPLITTIANVASASTITLANAASATLSSVNEPVEYGTPVDNAFSAAQYEAHQLGGRCVLLPAPNNGYTYIVQHTLMGNWGNVCIEGTPMLPKGSGVLAQNTQCANATCLEPLDPVHPAIILLTGNAVHYIHRLTSQYVPASGAFIPVQRPYFLDVRDSGGLGNNVVDHVFDVNGSHFIVQDCSPYSGCGLFNTYDHIYAGTTDIVFSSHYADNEAVVHDLHSVPYWGPGSNGGAVTTYKVNHTILFYVGRCDNCIFDKIDFNGLDAFDTFPEWAGGVFESYTGGVLSNATIGATTFFRALDPNNGNPPNSLWTNISGASGSSSGPLFQFTDFGMNAYLSSVHIEFLSGPLLSSGSGLSGSVLHLSAVDVGSVTQGNTYSWGGGGAAITNNTGSTMTIDGGAFYRSSATINSPIVQNSGTLMFNGNTGANAQWSGAASATSVSSCGTGSSVSGTWPHYTLTIGTGTPTTCTINLSATLSAVPVVTVSPRQPGNSGWNASTSANSIILGSAGFPSGTYDVVGLLN